MFLSLAGLAAAQSIDRSLLWRVVQTCVANTRITGGAFPCLDVHMPRGATSGYAVVRAPLETTHIVVTPTVRIDGVESPSLLEPEAENYFADAWSARHFVVERAPRPLARADIGLALNSRPGRSQDQLHIHVDCLQASVRDALRAHAAEIRTGAWSRLPFEVHNDRYWALKLRSVDLAAINIVQTVFAGLHVAEADRGKVTIVVAGAPADKDDEGFYLLAGTRARQNQGHGEFLLDHACAAT